MDCPDCTERVRVKINEHKTLSYRCDECDSNGYRQPGTAAYAAWEKKITRDTAPAPAPKPAPVADPAPPAPKPAPAKPAGSLLG